MELEIIDFQRLRVEGAARYAVTIDFGYILVYSCKVFDDVPTSRYMFRCHRAKTLKFGASFTARRAARRHDASPNLAA